MNDSISIIKTSIEAPIQIISNNYIQILQKINNIMILVDNE